MGLKETIHQMKTLIAEISEDLDKALFANKAASQRVRIKTIQLAKVSKAFRKESIAVEKKGASKSKTTKSSKKTAKKPAKKKGR